MGRRIGYARVSTNEQALGLALDALRRAGCAEAWILIDKASGARPERAGLAACLRARAAGDMLVVWRLGRRGRSMTHRAVVGDLGWERGVIRQTLYLPVGPNGSLRPDGQKRLQAKRTQMS